MLDGNKIAQSAFDVKIDQPFLIFEIGDILDRSDYAQLLQEFPAKSRFPTHYVDRGNKSYLDNNRPEFFEFLKTSPAWQALYRRFFDPAVVRKFYDIVAAVPSERPKDQQLPWRLVFGPDQLRADRKRPVQKLLSRLGGRTPAEVRFEFSYLEAGCYIPPHTDTTKKLISLMLYFPDEGVTYGDAAGTDFYRGKNGTPAWSAWKVGMLPDDRAAQFYSEHETFHSSPFEGNRLIGFVKSSVSWHGLKALQIPPGATRRSVNINYHAI